MGNYNYDIKGGKVKGMFNIYQSKLGSLVLVMGNKHTTLNLSQIFDLNINCYQLMDFNPTDFHQFYVSNATHCFDNDFTWEYNLKQKVRWEQEDADDEVCFYIKKYLPLIAKEEGYILVKNCV